MSIPIATIVVPCYRNENSIADIVSDITRQGRSDWELIVVGNGPGQEAQRKIVEAAAATDNRIVYVSIPTAGVSRARNVGIEHARGKWIAFVDADDRVPPDWLQNYLEHIAREPDMVVGGITYKERDRMRRVDIDLPKDGVFCDKPADFLPKFLSDIAAMYSPCTKLYRADFLRGSGIRFKDSISIYEDGIFNLELALKCKSMCFVRQSGYMYIQHPESSAIGRFHPCIWDAVTVRRSLIEQVLHRGEFSPEEITSRIKTQYAGDVLDVFLNEFREGGTKAFGEKVALTRQLFADAELSHAWQSVRFIMSNPPLAAFRAFYALNAPRLCVAAFSILFGLRTFWRSRHASS